MINKPVTAQYQNLHCKICDGSTKIYGVCDFNKSCEGDRILNQMPLIGVAVYYHRCNDCGFIFTIDFDTWSKDDFLNNIYNDQYIVVDPEYKNIRPKNCIEWFYSVFGKKNNLSVLDYGAGTNDFSQLLQNDGIDAIGWDPMWQIQPQFDKNKKFDVITAIEVLEHTPFPCETIREMINYLKPTGQIIFSTLVNDTMTTEGINSYYISPRNGHVCMYSGKSLEILFDQFGMRMKPFEIVMEDSRVMYDGVRHRAVWK